MKIFNLRAAGRNGGLKGGHSRSREKQMASARNGRLGGRPKRYPPCIDRPRHRFYNEVCKRCGFSRDALAQES